MDMIYSVLMFVFFWYRIVFDYCIINNLELNFLYIVVVIDEKINGFFENVNGVNIYLNYYLDKLYKFVNFELL